MPLTTNAEYVDATYLGWVMRIRRTNVTVYTRGGVLQLNTMSVPKARQFIREQRKGPLKEAETTASPQADPPPLRLLEREPQAGNTPEPAGQRVPGRARTRRSLYGEGQVR